ncbi:hypothetical protein PP178_05000 [Zeaxanthinibacter sp. PT1]|uniref:hypothetical protein n=1 Tax=Zeaxanthinibacter TaxID=561554 RepID=UPI002349C97C|nr:hypothetical protein [Zeaxanthinibacter sp. PT1]MDC6350899.1 hypothetical protein [Zeaxanthinibacter sp. PT1]
MGRKKNIPLTAIILEAFLVVLGVVLAFSINQCRENRDVNNHAAHALETVYREVENNRELIVKNLEYHRYLVDTLKFYVGKDSLLPPISLFNGGFIAQRQPLATAWEAARATDALRNMEYGTVLELSELYQLQQRYDFQARAIGDQLYGLMIQQGIKSILDKSDNLFNIIYMFIYREEQLLSAYATFLKDKDVSLIIQEEK